MKIVFRADASRDIGGGHIYRCLALADALSRRGAQCLFATASTSVISVPALALSGHELVLLEPGDEKSQAGETGARAGAADVLIVDHYGLGQAYEHHSRDWAPVVAAIDDTPGRPHDVDIIIDQTHGRTAAAYAEAAPKAVVLAGSSYALLRKQFPEHREQSLVRRRSREGHIERVLVAFGAADPEGLSGTALDILLPMQSLTVDILLGAAHPAARRMKSNAAFAAGRARLLEERDNVAELMAEADLAVGGAGVMSWERCALGLPVIIAIVAANQREVAHALKQAGAALLLGEGHDALDRGLRDAIAELMAAPSQVSAMSRSAAGLCDGRGAARVAEAILEIGKSRRTERKNM